MTPVRLQAPRLPRCAATSLKFRLFMSFCVSFTLCSGVLLGLLAQHQAKELAAILGEQATALAASVASLAHDKVAANDRIGLPARLETFNEIAMIRSLAITDRQGVLIAAVRRNAAGNMSAAPIDEFGELGTPGLGNNQRPSLFADPAPLVIWASIGKIAPIGWVRLEYEPHQAAQRPHEWLTAYLLALIVMTLAGALLAYRLAIATRDAFAPLVRAARQLQSFELDRIRDAQGDESLPEEVAEPMSAFRSAAALISGLNTNWSHNQEQYRQMHFALADPIVEIDSELRVIGANKAWQTMLAHGAPGNGAIIDSITTHLNTAELEHLEPGILALVRGTSETLHEKIRISHFDDGNDAWFALDAYRLLDQHGNFASLLLHASPLKLP